MTEQWYKFKMGSFVIYNSIVYEVLSVTSDNGNPNKYSLERVHPKEQHPIRDIKENQLKQWDGKAL